MTENVATISTGYAKKSDFPTVKMGEQGYGGLKKRNGIITENDRKVLRWPWNVETYYNMAQDPVIASGFTLIRSFLRNVQWEYTPPDNANKQEQDQTRAINEMMDDMTRPWKDFVEEAIIGSLQYGYNINEKVFKVRKGDENARKYKSKYDDGLVGWAKLTTLSQDTIDKFIYDYDNREFLGFRQNLSLVQSYNLSSDYLIAIPKEKVVHFRHNPIRDNPQGNSALADVYQAWWQKAVYEEQEGIGIIRNLSGIPKFGIPPEYLDPNAPQDKKALYEELMNIGRNLQNNEQACLIYPLAYEQGTSNKLFEVGLYETNSSANLDLSAQIQRYENQLLNAFLADVLKVGQDKAGAYNLADSKMGQLEIFLVSLLDNFIETCNKQLIESTYRINGWDVKRTGKLIYTQLTQPSLDEIGKYIQRVVSVGAVEKDQDMSDFLRSMVNLLPADIKNPMRDELTDNTSRSGDGMKSAGSGTSNKVGGGDKSVGNNENKAVSVLSEDDDYLYCVNADGKEFTLNKNIMDS